jgi:hypothetical protein
MYYSIMKESLKISLNQITGSRLNVVISLVLNISLVALFVYRFLPLFGCVRVPR